jgi:hypothetical protein
MSEGMGTKGGAAGPSGISRRSVLAQALLLGVGGCAGMRRGRPLRARPSTPIYDIGVRLEPAERRMQVSGVARFPAVVAERQEIRFLLAPLASEVSFSCRVGRSAVPVSVSDAPRRADREWTLRFAAPLPAGAGLEIRFSYRIGGQGLLFYLGPEVCFATAWGMNWYPLSLADHGGMATGSLQVDAPAGWKVVACHHPLGAPRRGGAFRYEVIHPTYFSFAAGPFVVTEQPGTPHVSVYALGAREHAASLAEGTQRMLHVLAREFGLYRSDRFALVEAPRPIAQASGLNACSLPGFAILNGNAFRARGVAPMLEWLGHELSHQWFPHILGFRATPNALLTEALAEYGGCRVVEEMGGAAAAERMRRIGFEPDPIYSAAAYFQIVANGEDSPLNRPAESPSENAARNVAYNKGGFVFSMLGRQIGVDRFQRAFHDITSRHAHGDVAWEEFLRTVERASGQDLTQFFEQWFERTGAPDFALSWRQDGDRIAGVVRQPAPYYAASAEVRVDGAGGQTRTGRVDIAAAPETSFSLPAGFAARDVVLDPHYKILRWTPEYRALRRTTPRP